MNACYLTMLLGVWTYVTTSPGQDDRYGFYFTHHRTKVQIPFVFRANLIIVPVRLNSRTTVNFMVDTGVSYTIITDATVVPRTTDQLSRTIQLTGVGQGDTQLASIVTGNTLQLGALRVDHHPLVVLHDDVLHLSEYAGMPIHGIIGYELFANLVVTLDFQQQLMTLMLPEHYHYRPRKGERYPIAIQDRKAYTNALSISVAGDTLPLRLVLDTGAGQALLLDRFAGSSLPIPNPIIPVPLGRGLSGLMHGQLGRLPAVQFGRFSLRNVLVCYPDSTEFRRKLAHMPSRQGNIGCELLRRFRVTFHYSEGYMVLKPVRYLMRVPFEHDMSGIEFRADSSQPGRYVIGYLVADSPAEQAKLQVGDELQVINNIPASQLSLGAINELLQSGAGRPISVIVRRQGQLIPYRFTLKRLI
ncbi:aspartyl protease family protein (plasmid) [Spirosoma sp. SC4-14]|uniref:aspartyl protease family protein n=1 Tax=Spirosoma sp. SC4-14 TaxID=3128900 RepID=UPI0030CDC816